MSSGLEMSLDEIIRKSRRPGGQSSNFRGRSRGSGTGPDRRSLNRDPIRANPYPMRQQMKVQDHMWQHQFVPIGGANAESGTKLYISNLEYGVTNEDINVLFSEVGDLKRYSIHYDRSGRSKGTAEVVFSRQTDALAAIKRYNNVQLDGKPMKIELVGVNLVTPALLPPTKSILGKPYGVFRSGQERVNVRGLGRGGRGRGGDRGSGAGRSQGRNRGEKINADDLDADLEKYRLEALKID